MRPLDVLRLRPLEPDDWPAVAEIYEQGIATRSATFEVDVPSWTDWDESHLAEGRIVAVLDGALAGWAALSPVSRRRVYAGVAEVSVYVAESARGRGVGRAVLDELVRQAEAAGIWTLQATVFPENAASLALHQRCGFRAVGRRERIAQLDGSWRDTVLMERRAP